MAQLVTVKLSRFDSQPWGFRLQGGKDFGQPLAVQKVNGSSLAEKAGLQAGDSLVKVNNVDLFNLTHKEAQNALVKAGNSFELTIQRGGSTWKPSVTPVGPSPSVQSVGNIQPVTKTSLAYNQAPAPAVGSQHNLSAKPFGGQQNGDAARNLTNKVYNSPINIYSEETIAETLSAQTEVLAGGVLGVNFKKNEKTYNAANSEVLKMVQEIDNEPREPEPAYVPAPSASVPTTPKTAPSNIIYPTTGLRHVAPPEPKAEAPQDPLKILPPGQNICADCERLIVGLFVRIKDKNLHVECFKCATCGTSLKNVGYYNISNKLYCDVHAKLVARQNPPAPNLEPVTIPPGVKPPSSVIGSALASAPSSLPTYQSVVASPGAGPGSPLPGTLGPLPFHAPQGGIRHVSAPRSAPFLSQAPAAAPVSMPTYTPAPAPAPAPKPNLGSSAPAPRPLSEPEETAGGIHYQSYATVSQSSYLSESQNVSFESSYASQQQESEYSSYSSSQDLSHKKMSICSQEVATHIDAQKMVKHLSEILEGQDRCASPTPVDEVLKRVVESEVSKEEKIQKIEQQQAWQQYQVQNPQLDRIKSTGLAFLRSHSTPVAELEAEYERQQKEIEVEQQNLQRLGAQRRISIDETQIREIENQIVQAQNQIIRKQEQQKEIEKKKRVRFEEEEEFRRMSLQLQESDLHELRETVKKQEEEERKKLEEQKKLQDEQKRIEESRRRQEEQHRNAEANRLRLEALKREEEERRLSEEIVSSQNQSSSQLLSVATRHDRARTPVADMEAIERHEGMSQKTETIFHTYEHLVQEEDEELEKAAIETPVKAVRPLTPVRGASPYPGSIPGAEVNLLLKNIQGIQFEFDLKNATDKPQPKHFKLPDLRNLSNVKPYKPQSAQPTPVAQPSQIGASQPEPPLPVLPEERKQSLPQFQPEVKLEPLPVAPLPKPTPPPALAPTPMDPIQLQKQQAMLQEQQIKEQRKQVHEELFLNERFRKKQERLGAPEPKFERSKTPVAELEEEVRHHLATDRTQHVYDSYDKVIQTADRPRSRIGLPVPENQTINDAEKSLFFQNISGINYEFENISELTAMKHLPENQKSLFLRDVEQRTQSPLTIGVNTLGKKAPPAWMPKSEPFQTQFVEALTTMPDTTTSKRSYEETLQQKHKMEQQITQSTGISSNLSKTSSMIEALTIASDRPYSPLPTLPTCPPSVAIPKQVSVEPKPVEVKPKPDIPFPTIPEPDLPVPIPSQQTSAPEPQSDVLTEAPQYDGARRRSSGFPGVNVQRTPYQMHRGAKLQSAFEEELNSQESCISQFITHTESSSVTEKQIIDPSFGLVPSSPQIAYAPPPSADKRAELLASQAKFGQAVQQQAKPEKPKSDGRPLSRPVTMVEALTIASDRAYSPLLEPKKPEATLVYGGANVALTKAVEVAEKAAAPPPPPPAEIKPLYQVKDLQLNKSDITGKDTTGYVEEKKEKAAESGIIEGPGLTGSYQCSEELSSSIIELQKVSNAAETLKSAADAPVTQQVQAEYSSLKQAESSQKSSSKTEQVQQIGNVTKTTKRSVVEVAEHSRKEFTQVKVIGGGAIDPVSGLRRTSSEAVRGPGASSFQPIAPSGLQKPSAIPTYQSLLSERVQESPVPAVPAGRIDSKDFKPRPRSAIGGQVSRQEPTNVPFAFRSRTPVPIPKIDCPVKTQPVEVRNKNLPTYNQDQVYRSASPRPISVPKPHFGSYGGPQIQSTQLKPSSPSVFRSTSPLPVPRMVKTNETYQQPMPSWRVQPNKAEKRVSWPPKEEPADQIPQMTAVVPQTSVKTMITLQEEQAQKNITEARRSSIPNIAKPTEVRSIVPSKSVGAVNTLINQQQTQKSLTSQQQTQKTVIKQQQSSQQTVVSQQQIQKTVVSQQQTQKTVVSEQQSEETRRQSVKAMVSAQEEQAKKNEEEARRSSFHGGSTATSVTPSLPKTTLAGKNTYPAPKHDPIVAPRPFGTPTPQRKIATPNFQPITPVAITEGPKTIISAPKLTFSTSQVSESSLERKSSLTLTSSSISAFKPLDVSPIKPVPCKPGQIPITSTNTTTQNSNAVDTKPDAGGSGAGGKGSVAGATAPRRGRGVLNPPNSQRVPLCAHCNGQVSDGNMNNDEVLHASCENTDNKKIAEIDNDDDKEDPEVIAIRDELDRIELKESKKVSCCVCEKLIKGPFISALGKIWCPDHFVCATPQCRRALADIGFVEEQGQLYCEYCFEQYLAPNCSKCNKKIKGDCLNAIGKQFHPECFTCAYCSKLFGNSAFFLEDGLPYCENDWNELFTTKCFACGFPIEAGDRWVEALNNNYHSQCFNCTVCKKNLEGQSFFAKGGRPFCKLHAR